MTLGSLCDGIGGWQLAAVRAGIKPVWSSEIDSFCCNVTRRHFPDTIQLGDLNQIADAPHVDIITAGTPCQNLSIAGNRSGINGQQSSLFFAAIKLVRRVNPQFFVWENVPGAFSSNGGSDFQTVLETILGEHVPSPKRWLNAGVVDGSNVQVCWRILDAQYWGVPQRRKRIFLVADFRGRRAAEILFERASLSGDFAPCKKSQRQTPHRTDRNSDCSVFDMTHADEVLRSVKGDKVNCLNARMGTGGNQVPVVVFGIGRDAFNQGKNAKFKPTIEHDLQPPLTARGAAACSNNGIIRRLTPVECERLQGLPDRWTEGGSDTQRYKALGNAMAQPCAEFVLRRIKEIST